MIERVLETRPATDSDFDFAWRIYLEAVRPMIEPKLNRAWDDADERERFRSIWQPANAHVITLDNQPIGWGSANISDDKAVIDHLYIEEQYRGKGYGTKLLSELLNLWNSQGKAVHASIIKENRAISLSHRLGFEQVHEDALAINVIYNLSKS
ncbi:MAG: GNAT family N-acetyltransferase [Acidobacteriota bacterium]